MIYRTEVYTNPHIPIRYRTKFIKGKIWNHRNGAAWLREPNWFTVNYVFMVGRFRWPYHNAL